MTAQVSSVAFQVGVPLVSSLAFLDANGAVTAGPTVAQGASVSADNPNVTVSISDDGSTVTATINAAGVSSTLTYTGTVATGTITAQVTISDVPPPPPPPPASDAVSVTFGAFEPVPAAA